ncbi:MAG: DUF362 domain-containing protein [Candidatus Mcinerneyibacterium aminivorans]|uniref:DUF362 domain-containing protein n=1 Tax=Candidatus Mcinerneyibacterium aminivorans TaxID=2703815 RepID=A0A5D0MCD9_9BACT|nr:MAG: DUF362 domain-containing protein [Candidatus Mcinerneyibacterium aminivorans]
MKSKVYMFNLRARGEADNKANKLNRIMDIEEFKQIFNKDELTGIKIHFGEKGNDGYINPTYVRVIVDKLKKLGVKPFLTDTNTLYTGERKNSVDHINTAIYNGFSYATVNAPVIIADGINSQNYRDIKINKKHFDNVKIASDILESDSLVVMSHFKGHILAGFGGAIKNLAMGCAPEIGKRAQHAVWPEVIEEKCIGCGLCAENCPKEAITIENAKAKIDLSKCIGCGECVNVCQEEAIDMDWDVEIKDFLERLSEYAYGAVLDKKEKVVYINFLMNITPDCDCTPWSDHPIVPDIGILASKDPVALDKASLDLVNKQKGFQNSKLKDNHQPGADKFKGLNPKIENILQLKHAADIGLGKLEYDLIEMDG